MLQAEAGFDYDVFWVDEHLNVADLKDKLQAAKPDAVCMGGGIRQAWTWDQPYCTPGMHSQHQLILSMRACCCYLQALHM